MAELGTTSYTRDNLVTSTKKLITDDVYTSTGVTRGQVLKLSGTVLDACLTGETPFTIALADGNNVPYMIEGSFLETEIDCGTGTVAEYRDALRAVGIIGER